MAVGLIRSEVLVPQAASRRLEDSADGEDDDLYRSSATGANSRGYKDCRREMELKADHENRPLWVTSGRHEHDVNFVALNEVLV